MWTSTSHLAVLGVIAHYVSEDVILQECLLTMEVVDGHREKLSQYPLNVNQDYGIISRPGYLQMDNAPDNETLIRLLSVGTSISIPLSVVTNS
jgi:hypothetical protein